MKIAVLSGKGGAGKTFVAVNLAATAHDASYIDCDVEEPNGHLFFKPTNIVKSEVYKLLPEFDLDKCSRCRKCVDFCHFNALIYIKEHPKVFGEICHSCGGCMLVCPEHAITEIKKPIGVIERGNCGDLKFITGRLNIGEASGIQIIKDEKKFCKDDDLVIMDCPPGSACSVMESISDADYCILVAEPTAFGFHNFKMVHKLASLLGKPCGVVINKTNVPYVPLEDYCKQCEIPVLANIPYTKEIAGLSSKGEIVSEHCDDVRLIFSKILSDIKTKMEVSDL